ncbi:MAG: hypothetical protein ACKVVT_10295 [Dehalococcoidia bacterium]
MSRLLIVGILAMVGAMLLAACGDDDEATPTATASASPSASPATVAPSPSPSAAPATPTRPASTSTVAPSPAKTAPAGYSTSAQTTAAKQPGGQKSILVAVRSSNRIEDGGTDRIVFEFTGGLPEARLEYRQSISRCGPGDTLDLGGFTPLLVSFLNTDAHNQQGQVTVTTSLGDTKVLKQVKTACDFEALVQYGLGVQGVRVYKLSTLENPPRVIVDIVNN